MIKNTILTTVETYVQNLLNDKSNASVQLNSKALIIYIESIPFDKPIVKASMKSHIDTIELYAKDPYCKTNERCLKLMLLGFQSDLRI